MSIDEHKQENMTTLAVAIGRVEEGVKGIAQQFIDFKIDTKENVSFIWKEIESLRNRVTGLEGINIEHHSAKGKISLWKIGEIIVVIIGLYFSWRMGNSSKG